MTTTATVGTTFRAGESFTIYFAAVAHSGRGQTVLSSTALFVSGILPLTATEVKARALAQIAAGWDTANYGPMSDYREEIYSSFANTVTSGS